MRLLAGMLSGVAGRNSTSRGFQPPDENKVINMNGGSKGNTRSPVTKRPAGLRAPPAKRHGR
jgi:hypothetical protein